MHRRAESMPLDWRDGLRGGRRVSLKRTYSEWKGRRLLLVKRIPEHPGCTEDDI